jgi:hypothetical protein
LIVHISSFGWLHYRIFKPPKPEKELPKDACLKKSDPKGLSSGSEHLISKLLPSCFLDQQSCETADGIAARAIERSFGDI